MKRKRSAILTSILRWIALTVPKFRYKVELVNFDKIESQLDREKGGILFLSNHAGFFIEPLAIGNALWDKYESKSLIIDRMWKSPLLNFFFSYRGDIPCPSIHSFEHEKESKQVQTSVDAIVNGLRDGENFFIFPSGKVKKGPQEKIASSSVVFRILSAVKRPNVVLIRSQGFWGSMFSAALTGESPDLASSLSKSLIIVLKNFIFWVPKRRVQFEFAPAPADFPYEGSRSEINIYLENWFNQYKKGETIHTEEPLSLVSYSFWKEEYPSFKSLQEDNLLDHFDLATVPQEVQQKILEMLSGITNVPQETIRPDMYLARDLELDSVDAIEIGTFLVREFKIDISKIPIERITTVKSLIGLAAGEINFSA